MLFVLGLLVMLPASAFAQAVDHRRGQGCLGRGAARGHGGSRQPRADRKVRSAVTDGSGQYRIVDLRPGIYAVTFSLPGFSTVKREGDRADRIVHRDRSTPT